MKERKKKACLIHAFEQCDFKYLKIIIQPRIPPISVHPCQWNLVLCRPFRAIKVYSVSFLTSPVKID